MICLQLFWSFLKIGFTSFGGLSMIPVVFSEMTGHGWMTMAEVSDIIAIAEMTPGPLGLNCATFAGLQTAGYAGAICANLGVLSPTLTLGVLAALFFERFKNSTVMRRLLVGIRPACIGLIVGMGISMSQTNYIVNGSVSPISVGIGVLDLFLLIRCKAKVSVVLMISAALGILFFGILG